MQTPLNQPQGNRQTIIFQKHKSKCYWTPKKSEPLKCGCQLTLYTASLPHRKPKVYLSDRTHRTSHLLKYHLSNK